MNTALDAFAPFHSDNSNKQTSSSMLPVVFVGSGSPDRGDMNCCNNPVF